MAQLIGWNHLIPLFPLLYSPLFLLFWGQSLVKRFCFLIMGLKGLLWSWGFWKVVCVVAGSGNRTVSDIWIIKEYGKIESWTKFVIVPFTGYINYYTTKVLSISEDDQVLLEVKKAFQSELVVYDPINCILKIHDIENFNDFCQTEIYIESLISPCS